MGGVLVEVWVSGWVEGGGGGISAQKGCNATFPVRPEPTLTSPDQPTRPRPDQTNRLDHDQITQPDYDTNRPVRNPTL